MSNHFFCRTVYWNFSYECPLSGLSRHIANIRFERTTGCESVINLSGLYGWILRIDYSYSYHHTLIMTKISSIFAGAIFLFSVQNFQASDAKAQAAIEAQPIIFGQQYLIPSKIYGEPREVNIYVPDIPEWGEGYFARPLPVLYLIDGGTDQDFYHIAGLAQLPLVNAERQPTIVVGIKTHNRRPEISYPATDPRYQTEFAEWQTANGDDFRRHIETEVMPFVQGKFETGRKVVMGESLAGLFVMEVFLRNPDMFDDYVSISPSLWWDDRYLAKNAKTFLEKHDSADRRLYVTMANEGGTMQKGLDELLLALTESPSKGLEVNYVDRRKEDRHSTIYHHSAREALNWLFGIEPAPYGETPWYLIEGANPASKAN
ncbi:MAG: alpha/beta hydrolase-fold protein [Parasphingorhabdus sp.]|uniref:alpha/beta hydrolase n=1 Tax=Parasphingorhabdus sp. TaxID=2709688 RepID=UPI003297F108